MPGWVNLDAQNGKRIDVIWDITNMPCPFEENTFDYILVDNVFEHLLYPEKILPELWRIAKNKAIIRIVVPYYNHKSAYNDLTHHHYFNKRTFENLFDVGTTYKHEIQSKFSVNCIYLDPTRFGKLFPSFFREKLSQYIGNVYRIIDASITVLK